MKCSKGLSLSFWMKFEGGDYILTSGGYAEGRNITIFKGCLPQISLGSFLNTLVHLLNTNPCRNY